MSCPFSLNDLGSNKRGVWWRTLPSSSPWLWSAPKNRHFGFNQLALSPSPIHYYIFCICTALDIICTLTPGRLVKPGCAGLKCVQSECRLDLRRTGLVESSIWEGSARHSPCLPCASALLCTLCCCCMRWTPKREWNGRFGAQVTETPQFQS